MAFRMAYLLLNLAHSNGQSHVMDIYVDIFKWRQIGQTLLMSRNVNFHMDFRLAYLNLTLTHSKGQGQCLAIYLKL